MKAIRYLYVVALVLTAAFSSCRTSKSVTEGAEQSAEYKSVADRMKAVIANGGNHEWQVLEVPVRVEISSPTNLSASAKAYLVPDSLLRLSVTILGFEVAQLQVTNDSIVAIDKYHKMYAAENLAKVLANVNVDMNSIQSLLLARPFTCAAHITDASQAKLFDAKAIDGDMWQAEPKKQNPLADYSFFYRMDDNVPLCTVISASQGVVTAGYESHVTTALGVVPTQTSITADTEKFDAVVSLRWSWSKAKTSGVKIRELKIPSDYRRIDSAALIKALSTSK